MVPVDGYNHVDLQWSPGLSLRLRDTDIAALETFSIFGRTRVRVRGLRPGETALEVVGPGEGSIVSRLDLTVLPRKTLAASFHFVSDVAGHATSRMGPNVQLFMTGMTGSAMATRTRPRNARSMAECVEFCLKELNDIFVPQTNVNFALRNFGQTHVDRDLGGRVNAESFDLRKRLRRLKDTGARINVFFVWDVMLPGHHAVGVAQRPLREGICLVDDETPDVGVTVAHEVGHVLLSPLVFHHFVNAATDRMLMHRAGSALSRAIPKRQAIHMNRQA
jgi:hypothetical protein